MTTRLTPTLDEFVELAKRGNVIPVFAEFIADGETPVSAFKKLDRGGCSFLFESTEKNDVSGRFSFVGVDPRAIIRSYGREIQLSEGDRDRQFHTATDPLDEVHRLMARYQFVSRPELPRFSGGAVGFVGYDAIRFFEPKVPVAQRNELHLPEMLFMITGSLLVFDHRLRSVKIIANAFLEDGALEQAYARAAESINVIVRQLTTPTDLPLVPAADCELQSTHSNFTPNEFEQAAKQAKQYIRAGDIFQVVLSQRFECEFQGDALDFYRCLRFINPSPYMFCLKLATRRSRPTGGLADNFALIGSSPEMHVRLVGDTVEIRPIAGTRPRGTSASEDERNAAELLADQKERAEHIMLVDLARNDVGRVAEFGSVRVTEFMEIERYSHVMHIVSNVTGRLRPACSAFDLFKATFPAGTVSGAPKIRAMQIISELEGTRRGCYAGAIGYFGFDGNIDSCIALRSVVLKHGKAYFQAGAGIVADSDPRKEYEETVSKARAMATALEMASRMESSSGISHEVIQPVGGDPELRRTTQRLSRRENLTRVEAASFLGALLKPTATDAQIAAALVALKEKGETIEELAGMAEAMRERAIHLHSRHHRFIDTAGTGSSVAKTFNVSTAAAFVIAGAGLPVAKHGARAATSNCGSADVLEALGVNTTAPPGIVQQCFNEHGICFIFAPLFHVATARVAKVRRELGVPTTFNVLGPLTNPARAPFQVVGVWDRSLLERVATALGILGVEKAWVVHGADGLDEITLAGETLVAACSSNSVHRDKAETFTITPHDFGLELRSLDPLRGSAGPAENANLIRGVFAGENHGAAAVARDLIIANAAAALHIAGLAPDLRQAAAMARESLDNGCAAEKLKALVRDTNRNQ